jgi:DnaJ-class molecular chaperone
LISIPPGVLPGTRYTFPEEGDQGPTKIAADIVFIVAEKHHDVFKRKDADLYMTYIVDLKNALIGFGFTINTVDGRTLNIPITTTPITPCYVKTVVGEGLPRLGSPNSRGNLYISFESELKKVFFFIY